MEIPFWDLKQIKVLVDYWVFNNIYQENMCYLKHVKSEENLDLNSLHLKEEDTPDTVLQEGNEEFL